MPALFLTVEDISSRLPLPDRSSLSPVFSVALRQIVADLEAVEGRDDLVYDMDSAWCAVRRSYESASDDFYCQVCLAGFAMLTGRLAAAGLWLSATRAGCSRVFDLIR